MSSYTVLPTTGEVLPKQLAPGGATTRAALGSLAQARTLGGPVTVQAPLPRVQGSVFGVTDTDYNAAANAITVDGDGDLIDGVPTLVIATSGVTVYFVFDAGQWCRLITAREFEGDPERLVLFARDQPITGPDVAAAIAAGDAATLAASALQSAADAATAEANAIAAAAVQSAADATAAYNAAVAAAPPVARLISAGAGLTGGGSLAADRTLAVANADGSISPTVGDLKVGILATDAQHGNRGGGAMHANAISGGAAGFMSGADKATLDLVAGSTLGSLPAFFVPSAVGVLVGTTWAAGNFTAGTKFKTHRALSLVAVRFWARWAGSKTITCRIYRSDTGANLGTVNVTLDPGAGQLVTATFGAAVALPASPVGTTYIVTVYESAGGFYPAQNAANAAAYFVNSALNQFFMAPGVLYVGNSWIANNALPTNTYNVGSVEYFPIDPVFG